MTSPKNDRFAFDRGTVRRIDADGRMHIEVSNISKANICPYLGSEIPDAESLGLDPKKVYQMLRDPKELEKAAPSFNNVQLLAEHVPVSADDPQKEIVVGSTGTDGTFHAPYLTNSLVIWDAEAIKGIESREQTELSCSYRYKPDMTPGEYEGQPYDGVMRNIQGNHVALVAQGRAGPDVVVADSALVGQADPQPNIGEPQPLKDCNMTKKALSGKATLAKGALLAAMPKLAADAKLDLNSILGAVTVANWKEQKPVILAAIKPKLAKDADLEPLIALLDRLDGEEPAEDEGEEEGEEEGEGAALDADPVEEILEMLKGKLSDEDHAAVGEKMKGLKLAPKEPKAADEPPPTPGTEQPGGKEVPGVSKSAMDAALKAVASATEKQTIVRLNAIAEAKEVVAPFVGKLAVACDSAEAVYRAALETMGVAIAGVHPSAYRHILEAQPKPGAQPPRARLAADSVGDDFATRFPNATRSI